MKDENRFYVYAYLDPRKPGQFQYGDFKFDYEPFYIGEGNGKRDKQHLTDAFKNNKPNKDKKELIKKILEEKNKPIIIRIKEKLSQKQALLLEIDCIATIGRLDFSVGPLLNKTNGGDKGPIGMKHTEETKNKISQAISGEKHPNYGKKGPETNGYGYKHTEEAKNKISKNHSKHWLNKTKSEETKNRISKSKKGTKMHLNTFEALKKYNEENERYNIKIWKLTSPNGKIIIVRGLQKFADENNLTRSKLIAIANNKRNHHKGWKCIRI